MAKIADVKIRINDGVDRAQNIQIERSGHTQSDRYLLQEQDSRDGVERRVFLDSHDNSHHEVFLRPVSEAFEFQASCGEEKRKSRWLYEVLPANGD